MRRLPYRLFLIASLLIGPLASLGSLWLVSASGAGSHVVVATYEGVINPVAAEYLHDALAFAESSHAQALVLKLDTPGGLDTSMRLIIKDMTNASIPVVAYVAPSGGRAASAGVFITMAAHVAAMAPGTNIGAAHPVAMGGGEMDKTMKEKVENDSVAYIKSIAEQRGRNVKWAEDAVRKSVSATEKEALGLKIIDLVVEDIPALLARLDGRKVALASGSVTLETKGVEARAFPMGWRMEALKALSDPNIAMLLMTIGTIGILAELYNPGAILPGVVGAISLILAFYSLQSLPINYAGVLLIVLGVVFFVLEIQVTSYGLLTLGGIASMTLGGLLLVEPPTVMPHAWEPDYRARYRHVYSCNPSPGEHRIVYPWPFGWPAPPTEPDRTPWEDRLDAVVMVAGDKRSDVMGEQYSARHSVVEALLAAGLTVHVYGRPQWTGLGTYCGAIELKEKVATMARYRYALAIENTSMPGYLTEKLPDALAAGCAVAYLGDDETVRGTPGIPLGDVDSLHDWPRFRAAPFRGWTAERHHEYLERINLGAIAAHMSTDRLCSTILSSIS